MVNFVPATSVGFMTLVSLSHGASWGMFNGNQLVNLMMMEFFQPGKQSKYGWNVKFRH